MSHVSVPEKAARSHLAHRAARRGWRLPWETRYAEIAFTPAVKDVQRALGSRAAYARAEGGEPHHDRLGPDEVAFIEAATASTWPP